MTCHLFGNVYAFDINVCTRCIFKNSVTLYLESCEQKDSIQIKRIIKKSLYTSYDFQPWKLLSARLNSNVLIWLMREYLYIKYVSPRYNWNIVESGVKHHNPIKHVSFVFSVQSYFCRGLCWSIFCVCFILFLSDFLFAP